MKKQHVEIALIILLVVVMYARPPLLSSFSKSVLGRLLLLVGILAITKKFGINAGMIGAFIMIILINNTKEGQKGGVKGGKGKDKGGDAKDKGGDAKPVDGKEGDAKNPKAGEGDGNGRGTGGGNTVDPNPQPQPVTPDPIQTGTAETRPGPGGPTGLMLSTDKMAKNRGEAQGGEEEDEAQGGEEEGEGGEDDDEKEGFTPGIVTLDRRFKENAERVKVAATCPHGGEHYGRVFRPF